MKSNRRLWSKSFSIRVLCFIFIIFIFLPQLLLATAPTLRPMTVPSGITTRGSTGNQLSATSGMSIRFLNRATIQVTFNNSSARMFPGSTNTSTVGQFSGSYIRDKHGDKDYKDRNTRAFIKIDSGFGDTRSGTLSERWDVLAGSQIRGAVQDGYLRMRIRSNTGGGSPNFGTNPCRGNSFDEWVGLKNLSDDEDDGQGNVGWWCADGQDSSSDTIHELNGVLTGTLENANITHAATEGAEELRIVFPGNDQEEDSFEYCESSRKYALEDCDDPRDGYTINAQPGDFAGTGSVLITVESSESGRGSFRTRIAQTENEDAQPTDPDDDGGDEEEIVDDCEFGSIGLSWRIWEPLADIGENALNWFGCTVIKGVITFIEWLNDGIDDYLRTNLSDYRGPDSGIREVWSSMLTIANILFVIAFLVMVIATALNLGIVDAYTVKKALPRLVIAAILANLSYSLILVVIDVTNVLGGAVRDIILQPVGGSDALRDAISAAQGSNASGLVGAGTAAGVGFAISSMATGGIFVVIPILLVVAFGVLVAWAVIMIRTILILLLVVLSPIAIAFWALPGLENLEKRWWKTLVQMLMVYPYIIGFIAAGQFVAILIAKRSGGEAQGVGDSIAVLAAIILPYVLLPTVFKLATSTISNVTGMINNKGKGLIDRGSNAARERAKTTKRAQGKDFAKKFKASERGSAGQLGKMEGMSRAGRRGGLRGRWARRGLSEESFDLLDAQRDKESVRRQSAQEEADKARVAGAQLDMRRHMTENGLSRNDQLTYLQGIATNQDAGEHERRAAVSMLTDQKAVEQLEQVQDAAVGNEVLRRSWNVSMQENYGGLRDASPHLATEVLAGEDAAAIHAKRVNSWTNASNEQLAGMHHLGWERYRALDPAGQHARLTDVVGNEKLRQSLSAETLGLPHTPPPPPSDRRFKHSVKLVGSQNGFNLYSFKYHWEDTRYVGVMAQEVIGKRPDAVSQDAHGYYYVDYSKLGIEFTTFDNWKN